MTLTDNLREVLRLHDDAISANFDANSCQTQSDVARARETEGAYEDALDAFECRLGKVEGA